MNVAYCSLLLPEEKKLAERAKERLSGISGHKVTYAAIKGIDENLHHPVTVFNIINTLNYPKFPQVIFHEEKWSHVGGSKDWHIGYINLFGIKYVTQAVNLHKKLRKWVRSRGHGKCLVCVHYIYYPAMLAAAWLKKEYGNRVVLCLNTGDVPGKYGLCPQEKMNLKRFLIEQIVDKGIMKMADAFDCFVFATKDMAEAFDVNSKPFVVLECVYTPPVASNAIEPEKKVMRNKKIVFYAGALREEYGIGHLLRAFSLIRDPDYRLVLAGGGSAEKEVRKAAKKDSRIKYIGFISPKEVVGWQQRSTVLINPRTSGLDYVKYSFPSKSVDSLASGKPYIAHKLPCDPPEYGQYIQYADDETDKGLRDKIVEICEMPEKEREWIGNKGKMFILNEKNPKAMCERIVDMWEKMV